MTAYFDAMYSGDLKCREKSVRIAESDRLTTDIRLIPPNP